MKSFFAKIKSFFSTIKHALHKNRKFSLRKNFFLFVLIIILTLIFTQALRSSVSAVIFIFTLLLPLVSLVYVLIASFSIKLILDTDTTEAPKFTPVHFSLTLSNETLFPFPFIEADIIVPTDDAVRCTKEKTRLSLIPFGKYSINKTLSFSYRGIYQVGATEIYCYDLFRFFRIRCDINLLNEIFIYPRELIASQNIINDLSDTSNTEAKRIFGNDNTEMCDIKAYNGGDSLRSIHWKLSSKTDELMVKQYSMNSRKHSVIICDTAARYDASDSEKYASDINEAAVDGTVEAAIAIVRSSLENDGQATLVWFDDRFSNSVCSIHLNSQADFNEIYHSFATAPVCGNKLLLAELTQFADITGNSNLIYISGCFDNALAASLSTMASEKLIGDINIKIYSVIPYNKITQSYKPKFSETAHYCRMVLEQSSITVFDTEFTAVSNMGGDAE